MAVGFGKAGGTVVGLVGIGFLLKIFSTAGDNIAFFREVFDFFRRRSDVAAIVVIFLLVAIIAAAIIGWLWWRNQQFPVELDDVRPSLCRLAPGFDRCAKWAREWNPDVILSINRGGAMVGGYVARSIDLPFIHMVTVYRDLQGFSFSYPDALRTRNFEEISKDGPHRVLVIDDTHWGDHHMSRTLEWLRKSYANVDVRTMVLVKLDLWRHDEPNTPRIYYCAYVARRGSCAMPWDQGRSIESIGTT